MKARLVLIVLAGAAFALGFLTSRPPGEATKAGAASPSGSDPRNAGSARAEAERKKLRKPPAEEPETSVRRLARDVTSAARWDELLAALAAWAAIDPKAALEEVKNLAPDRQHEATAAILGAWTRQDPEAAWKWASAQDPENAPYIDAVLTELGKTDASLAWNFADEFARAHPSAAEYAYTNALLGMVRSGGFEDAVALVQQAKLPASPDSLTGQYQLAEALAGEWARVDPEKAAAWVRSWPEGIAQRHALIGVSQAWSEADPERAAEFARQLPPGDVRRMAVTQTVTSWLETDPEKAGEWMNRYEPGPDFDNAVYVLATAPGTMQTPDTAISWAGSITDRELRRQALHTVVADWAKRDRAAALDYLANSPQLPAETRAQLRDEIGSEK